MAVLEQMAKLNWKKDKWIAMLRFPVATESGAKKATLICKILIWQESNYAQKCGAACRIFKTRQSRHIPPPQKKNGGKKGIHLKWNPIKLEMSGKSLMYRMCAYTLTSHLIIYTLPGKCWTPFCLESCLKSSWCTFNKVLEKFLWDNVPYGHNGITQLLQICRPRVYDVNLPFHNMANLLDWDL